MDGWNITFLLGRLIFMGYVGFREGNILKHPPSSVAVDTSEVNPSKSSHELNHDCQCATPIKSETPNYPVSISKSPNQNKHPTCSNYGYSATFDYIQACRPIRRPYHERLTQWGKKESCQRVNKAKTSVANIKKKTLAEKKQVYTMGNLT